MSKNNTVILIGYPMGATKEEIASAFSAVLRKLEENDKNSIGFNVTVGSVEELEYFAPMTDMEILAKNISSIIEEVAKMPVLELPDIKVEELLYLIILNKDKTSGNLFTKEILNTLANANRKQQKLLAGMGLEVLPKVAKIVLSLEK